MPHDLLAQMSSAAREEALSDPRWEDFARGALSGEERDSLLAKAREAGVDEGTIDALGPRDGAYDERLAEAARAELRGPARRAAAAPANDAAPAGRPGGAPSAKAAPLGARARRIAAVVVVGLAAAAAAALALRGRPADLPAFAMTIEGGTRNMGARGDEPGDVVNLAPGNRVVLSVRPEKRVERPLEARVFLYGQGQSAAYRGPVAVTDAGSVRVLAPAEDLFEGAAAGRWKLCVVVGDPETAPASPGAAPPAARTATQVTVCQAIAWAGAPAR